MPAALPRMLVVVALLVAAPRMQAQDLDAPGAVGTEVTIQLTNGDQVTGTLLENQGVQLVLEHRLLGRIVVPRTAIAVPEPEPPAALEPATPWSGAFDAYLNGSSGNTDEHKYGASFNLKRENEDVVDSYLFTYAKDRTYTDRPVGDGETTKDQIYARARREWKLDPSRWRPFVQAADEIDKSKDYSHRIEAAAGAGYLFIEEPGERFIGRLGAGANRKVGAKDEDDWNYEALLGLDYSLDVSTTSHIAAETTFFPQISPLSDFAGDYRTQSKAEWRLDLSEASPWYFKLGADHAYDSEVAKGDSRHDFKYYTGVGSTF